MDAIALRRALKVAQVVGADLMAEAARSAMYLDGDVAFDQTHDPGGFLIEDFVNHIHLDEVIARAQRPDLFDAALDGSLADLARIGGFQASTFLGAAHVVFVGITLFERPLCAAPQQVGELLVVRADAARLSYAAGTVLVEGRGEGRVRIREETQAAQRDGNRLARR